MKNNEIIQITALVVLAAALIYRKYGRKKKAGAQTEYKMPGESQASDDDYEPYSDKTSTK